MKMKALILSAPNCFSVEETLIPEVGEGDILLQMKASAICGTDIRILEGKKTKGVRYPSIIGHEICGLIHSIGKNVKGFALGDKIAIAPVIPCHACHSCLHDRENACLNRKAIGYEFDGGFAEYVLVPRVALDSGNAVKLPEHVSFKEGALIEPLSCCIRGLRNAGIGMGDNVLIIGTGPIGLMHVQLSKLAGAAKVIVSEPMPMRREKALVLGADVVIDPQCEDLREIVMRETGGLGADVVIMAIGVPDLVDPALKLCRRGGTVNLFAGFSGTGESRIEANTIHYNEINVNGSTAFKRCDYLDSARLVSEKKINLEEIISHTFGIEEFGKAYDVCKSLEGLKVIIEP